MQKQIRIFLSGVFLVAPFAITVYAIWWSAKALDWAGDALISRYWPDADMPAGVGAVVVLVAVYLVGLLTHVWLFKGMMNWLDKLIGRIPVVNSIYQSVRDVLGMFAADSNKMGRVVRYKIPGTDASMLGILTNEAPDGAETDDAGRHTKVAVYVPFGYMIGGITVFVPRQGLEKVDMSVERAMKLCATAYASAKTESTLRAKE